MKIFTFIFPFILISCTHTGKSQRDIAQNSIQEDYLFLAGQSFAVNKTHYGYREVYVDGSLGDFIFLDTQYEFKNLNEAHQSKLKDFLKFANYDPSGTPLEKFSDFLPPRVNALRGRRFYPLYSDELFDFMEWKEPVWFTEKYDKNLIYQLGSYCLGEVYSTLLGRHSTEHTSTLVLADNMSINQFNDLLTNPSYNKEVFPKNEHEIYGECNKETPPSECFNTYSENETLKPFDFYLRYEHGTIAHAAIYLGGGLFWEKTGMAEHENYKIISRERPSAAELSVLKWRFFRNFKKLPHPTELLPISKVFSDIINEVSPDDQQRYFSKTFALPDTAGTSVLKPTLFPIGNTQFIQSPTGRYILDPNGKLSERIKLFKYNVIEP